MLDGKLTTTLAGSSMILIGEGLEKAEQISSDYSDITFYIGAFIGLFGLAAKWFDSVTGRMRVKSEIRLKERELDIQERKLGGENGT